MKEIGGYFGLEQSQGDKEYYENLICLNTGRNALIYVCKAKKISKVYIPYYLCDSISNVLDREKIQYEQYHIDKNFMPKFEKNLKGNEYLYIVNYYGLLNNQLLLSLKTKYKNIIVDNIHAFFQEPIDGIDTIYSCRKFFGVPDGAYLSTNSFLNEELRTDDSENRLKHIYGRIRDGASVHYNEFKENDYSFKKLDLMYMSNITHCMLKNIDYEFSKNRRKENFNYLHQFFKSINKLKVDTIDVPYAYPLYLDNGMEIKKKLAEKKIYVATLWPNVLGFGGIEQDYAKNILPIPCDQRYDKKDMKFIVEVLKNEYKR